MGRPLGWFVSEGVKVGSRMGKSVIDKVGVRVEVGTAEGR